ncbi:hypothetical protein [Methyloradius palustris]|uniref:hypothetical protein n=1 Tax=Methyloradius palustris TaxID=2778876 RepID=UPI001C8BC918|nr:hypothetical protein [Methyloradius palustris]
MVNRIPPSLNWLIDKRARLAGDIQRTNKALLKVQHLVSKLRELETALEAVDRSLQLHEIQVDVENIKPIRSHQTPKLKFQHGDISHLVLMHLRSQKNNSPIAKHRICLRAVSPPYVSHLLLWVSQLLLGLYIIWL